MDENLSWKGQIEWNRNKKAKTLGLLHKANYYLKKASLFLLHYLSFILTLIMEINPGKIPTEQSLKKSADKKKTHHWDHKL